MCGIAGYARLAPRFPIDLHAMTQRLAHRGPDEDGFFATDTVGLAMRRLAIIDVASGQQPITNETCTLQLVYNGEIYNYVELRHRLLAKGHLFKTNADTEVLVHGYEEWGTDLPRYLRGMFAFALWDDTAQRLFLCRDHFGIKPLYYALVDDTLLFGSEIKAFLPYCARTLDPIALDHYLSFLYVPEPRTIYQSIQALPPAHTLLWQQGTVRTERYWTFDPSPDPYPSKAAAIQAIQETFADSVQRMLMAEVPLGAFLSGGIDSTSIVAMMGPSVRTFSIGFGKREHRWDELEAARQIAAFYKTEHTEFRVTPDVVALLPRTIAHFDQPFANPTAILMGLLAAETRRHVTVALAGTGGDELFAGYPRYRGMVWYEHYQHLPTAWRRKIGQWADHYTQDGHRGRLAPQRVRRFLESGAYSFDEAYARVMTVIDPLHKQRLYTAEFREKIEFNSTQFLQDYLVGKDRLARLMAADLATYLPFNQLAYADRMSMAHSLEVRVPFVDQGLVEVASRIPLRWKLHGGRTKGLFREAMRPFLPPHIVDAPKRGLNLPIALWFQGELRAWLHQMVEQVAARGIFERAALLKILTHQKRDYSLFLWALVGLETWYNSAV